MTKIYKILAVNPGSTSTKIAFFENDKKVFSENIEHGPEELKKMSDVQAQLPLRIEAVRNFLAKTPYKLEDIDLFSGRGAGLLPLLGGTYEVDEILLDHASKGAAGAAHPAQLGSQIASALAKQAGGKAYIVNSPDTDEYQDMARITGFKDIFRNSSIHALNQKEIALRYCAAHNIKYEEVNLIICHIGGGLSVTAHQKGKMVDSNHILGDDGPMSPNRAGTMPSLQLVKMCFSGKYTEKQIVHRLTREGGITDHLGTSDTREVEKRIKEGDQYAALVYHSMIYQVAKYVGSMACVLKGKVQAIILTGGLANSEYLVKNLSEYIDWIAPIEAIPGEFEMEALAAGALRVALGQEIPKKYSGKTCFRGFDHLKKSN
jgi:butyrate kinase